MLGSDGRIRSRVILLLIVAAIGCAISNAMRRDLLVGDETRYAKISDEMWDEGALIIPTLEGRPYPDKPPAYFWLINVIRRGFAGPSEWPLLLPALIAYVAMTFIAWALTRYLFGPEAALVGALVFSTSYVAWVAGQIVRMDMPFAVALSAGFGLLHVSQERESRGLLFAAAISFGAASLFKGPVALLLALVYLLLARRWRCFGVSSWIAAALVAVVPLVPWIATAGYVGGEAFIRELVLRQTLDRLYGTTEHLRPFWHYSLRLPGILFPWFFPLAVAVAAFVRRNADQWCPRERFLLDWMIAVFVTFSLISSKLDVYLLPMALPAAAFLGAFSVRTATEVWVHRARIASAASLLIAAVGVVGVLATDHARGSHRTMLAEPDLRSALVMCAIVSLVSAFLVLQERSVAGAVTTLATGALGMLLLVSVAAIPRANEIGTSRALLDELVRYQPETSIRVYGRDTYLWSTSRHALCERIRYSPADALRTDEETAEVVVAKESTVEAAKLAERNYHVVAKVEIRDRPWLVLEREGVVARRGDAAGDSAHSR